MKVFQWTSPEKSISQNPMKIVPLKFTKWVQWKPTFNFKEKIHCSVPHDCRFLHGQTVDKTAQPAHLQNQVQHYLGSHDKRQTVT